MANIMTVGNSKPTIRLPANIENWVEKFAPELGRKGSEYHGRCPFPGHEDLNPSFGIHVGEGEKKGVWVCSCGTGTFLSFVMQAGEMGEREARDLLTQDAPQNTSRALSSLKGLIEKWSKPSVPEVTQRPIVVGKDQSPVNDYLTAARPRGREYSLEDSKKQIKTFDLRICIDNDRTNIYDWVVVPIHDADGHRVMWLAQDPKTSAKYNGGTTKGLLFNLHRVKKRNWVIVVESIWCAMRLQLYGFPAVATFGARIDPHQAFQIQENFRKVYLCYDRYDESKAGMRAQQKAIKMLTPQLAVRELVLPDGKDPDKCSYDEIQKGLDGARRIGIFSV